MEKIVNKLIEKKDKGEIGCFLLATDKTFCCNGNMSDLLAAITATLREFKDKGLGKEDAIELVNLAFSTDSELEKMNKEAQNKKEKLEKVLEELKEIFGDDDDE